MPNLLAASLHFPMGIFWIISLCAVCVQQSCAQIGPRQAPNVTASDTGYSSASSPGWETISQYNRLWTVHPTGFPVGSQSVVPGGPAATVAGIVLSLDTQGVVTFAGTAIPLAIPTVGDAVQLPAKAEATQQRAQVRASVSADIACIPAG